jgi:putative membrane protein
MYPIENKGLAKRMRPWAWFFTVVVLGLVGAMQRVKIDLGVDFSFLPTIYSALNALVAVFLLKALYHITRKEVTAHYRSIYIALTGSSLFLLLYVLYHITTESTHYCGEGAMKAIYLVILLTHIAAAALSFPFILFTFIRGFTWQVAAHRRMARWVFWVWLYVAVTGPICYLMLMPCR